MEYFNTRPKTARIINPTNPEYKWVLPEKDLKEVIKECNKVIERENGKLRPYREGVVERLQGRFTFGDLAKVIDLLKKNKENGDLIKKIKKTYTLPFLF